MKNILLPIAALSKFKYIYAILLLTILIFSCKKEVEEKEKNIIKNEKGYALGTTYNIKYENLVDDVDFKKEIEKVIEEVNKSMSTYIPSSDISKINKGDSSIIVDAYFKEVFYKAKEVWKKTEGTFDPTVGSLVNAWGFGPEDQLNNISQTQIDSILNYVGFEKLILKDDGRIIKEHPEIFLDFNALAKGYTIDLIGRVFDKYKIDNYLIELGGEILVKGKNPDNKNDWTLAIDDPSQEDLETERRFITTLKLSNAAMATSGNYRKFRVDSKTGERYVHTIDPITGYSKKSNVLSASVIASTCMEADAYATAFMAMDLEKTKSLLPNLDNIEAYIVFIHENDSLQIFSTPGFKDLLPDD